jgi:hypothetical protein
MKMPHEPHLGVPSVREVVIVDPTALRECE